MVLDQLQELVQQGEQDPLPVALGQLMVLVA